MKPHTRYGPFLIGILTGIYLTTKKEQLLKNKVRIRLLRSPNHNCCHGLRFHTHMLLGCRCSSGRRRWVGCVVCQSWRRWWEWPTPSRGSRRTPPCRMRSTRGYTDPCGLWRSPGSSWLARRATEVQEEVFQSTGLFIIVWVIYFFNKMTWKSEHVSDLWLPILLSQRVPSFRRLHQ